LLRLLEDFSVCAMAHITGGGIPGNLARVIPTGCRAVVDTESWEVPAIFRFLQRGGKVPQEEMWRTFNNGIGMVLVVRPQDADAIVARMRDMGEGCFFVGEIARARGSGVEMR
jgi:phosphoribosylformylglycinamidine cyclo-ligase